MMSINNLDELNKAINRALRLLNGIAVNVPSVAPKNDAALAEIVGAVERMYNLQRLVVALRPDLEYHSDPAKPPTRVMKDLAELLEEAETHIRAGNLAAADEVLKRACDLEPPPLAYEQIEKRLRSLRSGT
jgi:Flp pilus assembly protein TadD